MAHINLLPWRELERKKRQREFGFVVAGAVVLTLLAGVYSHIHINGLIEAQNRRNTFLRNEIQALDKKISEIKELEKVKANLLARMEIIQQLQVSRPQIVHLFDEIVNTLPDGVYLTRIEQKGDLITIKGRAQSNARVSAYMRNIEKSEWLNRPTLKVIENKEQTQTGLSHFTLQVKQVAKGAVEGAA
ncbi:MAG TPA: pilus assembly protein PilN [Chromatiales bacterium]|nr:pilus assembly protein PilN [Chromatiales bacterium]